MDQEKRYEQLYRITAKLHSSMKMEEILSDIINTFQDIYPSLEYFMLLSHGGNNYKDLPIRDLEYDTLDANKTAVDAFVSGETKVEQSLEDEQTVLYVPIKGKQAIYGVLQVVAPELIIFPENEVDFIILLAGATGSAIENAKLYEQSQRLISDLQLINEATHQLNSSMRLTDMIEFMSDKMIQSFGADEFAIVSFDEKSDSTDILTGSSDFFFKSVAKDYINYVKKQVKDGNESLFIGDVTNVKLTTLSIYRSLMAVPMIQRGVFTGAAILLHKDAYKFSYEDYKLMQSLIHHAILALTNFKLREELERTVNTDYLTGLYSRPFLNESMEVSMKQDHYGTLILTDIDNFKEINDTYGHQVGDHILIQVANCLNENTREEDIAARWGGEELAIYLPNVTIKEGKLIAQRVVKHVELNTVPKVTISCGVSSWREKQQDTINSIFQRADAALYIAKKSGKNQMFAMDEAQMTNE